MKFVRRILYFTLALEMTLGGVAGAQDAAAPSSIERKNRAPVSDEVLEVTLPRAVEATLDNGLRILVLEDHRVPIVSMELSISGAGPIYEPAELVGLAGMTARMLREGTTNRSNQEILEVGGVPGICGLQSEGVIWFPPPLDLRALYIGFTRI